APRKRLLRSTRINTQTPERGEGSQGIVRRDGQAEEDEEEDDAKEEACDEAGAAKEARDGSVEAEAQGQGKAEDQRQDQRRDQGQGRAQAETRARAGARGGSAERHPRSVRRLPPAHARSTRRDAHGPEGRAARFAVGARRAPRSARARDARRAGA